MEHLLSYCASAKNPPKGYGSIEAGMKVMAYRSKRLKHWAAEIGGGLYTDEVFTRTQADVVAKWGEPF